MVGTKQHEKKLANQEHFNYLPGSEYTLLCSNVKRIKECVVCTTAKSSKRSDKIKSLIFSPPLPPLFFFVVSLVFLFPLTQPHTLILPAPSSPIPPLIPHFVFIPISSLPPFFSALPSSLILFCDSLTHFLASFVCVRRSSPWATVPQASGWLWEWRAVMWKSCTCPNLTSTSCTSTRAVFSH